MSDDYDDDPDEPGGLWDPDAFDAPPAPARPALQLVTSDRIDRPVDATNEEAGEHTLVRLEQFRTASDGHVPSRTGADRPILRRAAAAGILASVVAAVAVAYGTSSPEYSDRPASVGRVAAVLAVDSEHAAATREVAPAAARVRNSRQPKSRTRQRTESKRRSVIRPHNGSATRAQHVPTVPASPAPATSTTVVRGAAPIRRQTPATSATSEFGFEG
jgi:hypothetical protein